MPFIRVSREVYGDLKLWKLMLGHCTLNETLRYLLGISQKRKVVSKTVGAKVGLWGDSKPHASLGVN